MNLKLVLIRGTTRVREVPLRGAEVVLGRARDCGLRIAAHEVSRRHCRIRQRGEKITVLDLGSANGTFVNGQQVTEETVLLPGDLLLVGSVLFLVEPLRGRVPAPALGDVESTPDADDLVVLPEQEFELVDQVQPAEAVFEAEPAFPLKPAEDELVPMELVEFVDAPLPETTPLPRADADVEELPRADVDDPAADR